MEYIIIIYIQCFVPVCCIDISLKLIMLMAEVNFDEWAVC